MYDRPIGMTEDRDSRLKVPFRYERPQASCRLRFIGRFQVSRMEEGHGKMRLKKKDERSRM